MRLVGNRGSLATLICDGGDRYADTYYNDDWLTASGLEIAPYLATLREFARSGNWHAPTGHASG